ncbi:MAG: DUF4012 domain-containing protein [Actinobacteria bacterium]|nr:MAG: DUF4012 domain-containing protein [Actinomycetota bacterium]
MIGRVLRWLLVIVVLVPLGLTALALAVVVVTGAVGGWALTQAVDGNPNQYGRAAGWLGTSAIVAGNVVRVWEPVLKVLPGPLGAPGRALDGVAQPLVDLGRAARTAAPSLPAATGADGPKRYLVAALNEAEMYGSGGALLYVAMVEFDQGRPSVPLTGSVNESIVPRDQTVTWDYVGGPPWYNPGDYYFFATSNLHPEFPFAGQDIQRAWAAIGRPELDGVITMDVTALSDILDQTGPVESPGYGQLTAQNIVRKVLVDAYRQYPEEVPGNNEIRRDLNDGLRQTFQSLVTDPANLPAVLRGITEAIPGRHVQGYMDDAALQEAVGQMGAQGQLVTGDGDVIGEFMQAGGTKVSIFQQRSIDQTVDVAADGSARVTRRVTTVNAVPSDVPGDATASQGYLGLVLLQHLAHRIPGAATAPAVSYGSAEPLVAPDKTGPYPDGVGGQVMWQGGLQPPGSSVTQTVTYDLPAGTFGTPGKLRYSAVANPQAMAQTVNLQVKVTFAGDPATSDGADGWQARDGALVWQGALDRTLELQVAAP